MIERNDTEFEQLALGFPALKKAAGISPWSPNRLDIWATEEATEPAAVAARSFCWRCGIAIVVGNAVHLICSERWKDGIRITARDFLSRLAE